MSVERLYKPCYWKHLLEEKKFKAASVASLPNAPLSSVWSSVVRLGTVVEVQNSCCVSTPDQIVYWWASVVDVQGYFVKLRYLGSESEPSSAEFWMNVTSTTGVVGAIDYDVHPVGWSWTNKKPLRPPKSIEHLQKDWKSYSASQLRECFTLPENLQYKFYMASASKFKPGMKLETVDMRQSSYLTVAIVDCVIGRRLRVHKEGDDAKNKGSEGFWFHELSPMIHPVGWAKLHGQEIHCSQLYEDSCLEKILTDNHGDDEAPLDCFAPLRMLDSQKKCLDEQRLEVGMKLEFLSHQYTNVMSVGTIRKILQNFFLMIEADSDSTDDEGNQMCFHVSSNHLYPAGYARLANIKLQKPAGYENRLFRWQEYLEATKSAAAPAQLFLKILPEHNFEVGQFVEATDLLSPENIHVARVQRVVDRLLLIHYEGFSCEYDQWFDCESPDIYPIGWCHSVGYRLSHPGDGSS